MNEGQIMIEITRLIKQCNETTDQEEKEQLIKDIEFYNRQLNNYGG